MKPENHQMLAGALIAAVLTIGAGVQGAGHDADQANLAPLMRTAFVRTVEVCRDRALGIAFDLIGEAAARAKQL